MSSLRVNKSDSQISVEDELGICKNSNYLRPYEQFFDLHIFHRATYTLHSHISSYFLKGLSRKSKDIKVFHLCDSFLKVGRGYDLELTI